MATKGTSDVRAANSGHAGRADLRLSIASMPRADTVAMLPKKAIDARSPFASRCEAAHSSRPHCTGWRVMRSRPRGSSASFASAPTLVGFGTVKPPTMRNSASGIASIGSSVSGGQSSGACTVLL